MAVASHEEAAERTWSQVADRARRELAESSYAMWFTGVRATSLQDGVLEVAAPSDYVRDWLAKHYVPMIERVASDAAGSPVRVHLVVSPVDIPPRDIPVPEPAPTPERPGQHRQTPGAPGAPELPFPKYTFETFVAGP
ncbi:MAG TPA: DnaA N-terminal domain-containing protein, partial [Actinomycetota bacterium]|nr:DnaA N-terminal domain-containing protein [Actinomycetota bacterium]